MKRKIVKETAVERTKIETDFEENQTVLMALFFVDPGEGFAPPPTDVCKAAMEAASKKLLELGYGNTSNVVEMRFDSRPVAADGLVSLTIDAAMEGATKIEEEETETE